MFHLPLQLESPSSDYYAGLKEGVSSAAMLTTSTLFENTETLLKVTHAVFNAFSLIPHPVFKIIGKVSKGCKEIKNLFNYVKGIRSVKGLMCDLKQTWHSVAYNILGLALTFFSTLDYVRKLTGAATLIHRICVKAPIVGILSFAGIFDGIMITVLSYELYQSYTKYKNISQRSLSINEKINFWGQELTQERIIERIASLQKRMSPENLDEAELLKTREKCRKWRRLYDIINENESLTKDIQKQKVEMWKQKQGKVGWEKISALISACNKVIKIGLALFTTGLLFSGIGVAAMPFIKAGCYLIEATPYAVNYFVKRHIKQIHIEKVQIPEAA